MILSTLQISTTLTWGAKGGICSSDLHFSVLCQGFWRGLYCTVVRSIDRLYVRTIRSIGLYVRSLVLDPHVAELQILSLKNRRDNHIKFKFQW